MPLYKGSTAIGAVYHGSTAISRVYKGDTLVFEAGGGFSPDDLASLQAWWDADFHSGAADSAVDPILDRMGTYDALNVGAGSDPILRHNSLNGRKQIEFTGGTGQSQMAVSNTLNLMEGATEGCYFAVVTCDNETHQSAILDAFSATSAAHFPYVDGNIYEPFGTSSRKTVGNPTPILTLPRIYSAHSASGSYKAYLDGTQIFTTGTNTVSFGTESRRLGYNRSLNYFDGKIAEILIFNSFLTQSEREQVEGYLAHKWFGADASNNLPALHPYKSVAP